MVTLKWCLRAVTLCCVILPLLFTVLAYHNNLEDLLIPPKITSALSGNDQTIQEIIPDFSNMRNAQPIFNDDFRFNPEDRTFGFSMNLTSPLNTAVTCNSFSLTVTGDNETILGTINLESSVTLIPGENSMIPIEGELSQELITLLQNSDIDLTDPNFSPENMEEISLAINNIHFSNVDVDVGGIQIHIDKLDPVELFESLESKSTERQ